MLDPLHCEVQWVTLTWPELMQAGVVALLRNITAMRDGREPSDGCDEDDTWTVHVEGAAGEQAFAKGTDRFWSASVNTFHAPDVGKIQVRTRSKHWYDLKVKRSDNDNEAFVLVTGKAPRFALRGWLLGRDAKKPEFLQSYGKRPPAYFVPERFLLPLSMLDEREKKPAHLARVNALPDNAISADAA